MRNTPHPFDSAGHTLNGFVYQRPGPPEFRNGDHRSCHTPQTSVFFIATSTLCFFDDDTQKNEEQERSERPKFDFSDVRQRAMERKTDYFILRLEELEKSGQKTGLGIKIGHHHAEETRSHTHQHTHTHHTFDDWKRERILGFVVAWPRLNLTTAHANVARLEK